MDLKTCVFRKIFRLLCHMICSWHGFTNLVFTNPESSICYFFFTNFFLCILTLKQKSVLEDQNKQQIWSRKLGIRETKRRSIFGFYICHLTTGYPSSLAIIVLSRDKIVTEALPRSCFNMIDVPISTLIIEWTILALIGTSLISISIVTV